MAWLRRLLSDTSPGCESEVCAVRATALSWSSDRSLMLSLASNRSFPAAAFVNALCSASRLCSESTPPWALADLGSRARSETEL